ncbi:Dienelactone hydrolase [Fontimonas thermophila]|uniref:Dienelactone hydrolase n=1 Tax=Fontimonas thermophila TaxID=1076937 RepID=A0A1I2KIN5_9GAMM|nr:dienelactone hydrolase family protein [Fontimonas thermophila]SFF64961.1 Dienelactone hydrolase [Fontimonas thermophila]
MSIVRSLRIGVMAAAPALAAPGLAAEKIADYVIDGQIHRGYFYYDERIDAARPLVVLVPNWLGTTAANRRQAADIAGRDYVVFVADMFGKDAQPADAEAASKAVRALYADRPLLRKRIVAAKAAALAQAHTAKLPVDPTKVAAIGFCFGGATVLELARTGEALAAVVSFHGNLSLPGEMPAAPIRTRILALHGDADPYVPAEQVEAFTAEMRASAADWQLVRFGGAVHSFTDPEANRPGQAMYDAKIARRAFAMMRDFLAEAFAQAAH